MKIDVSTVTIELEKRSENFGEVYSSSLFVNVLAKPVLGLDRSHVYGWSVGTPGPKAEQLAARLSAAVLAGKVFQGEAETRTDVNGKTYLSAQGCQVFGRRMNADLQRLGF
jgi:hypothetical protein